jgi:DNA-binding PadR family transcriptional regulator
MTLRPLSLVLLALSLTLWTACAGSETVTDETGREMPSENAAEDAIEESLMSFNEACISPKALSQGETFPITLIEPDTTRPTVAVRQFLTLEDAGLVTSNRVVDDRRLVKNTFTLTDDGEKSLSTVYQFRGWRSALCYATPEVTRIDTIYALRQRGPRPLADVKFAYQLVDVADWARRDDIQQSYPDIQDVLDTVGQTQTEQQTVVLTDTGWRALRVIRRTDGEAPPEPGETAPSNSGGTSSDRNRW